MPTFVMLTNLTSEGVQTLKNNPSRIQEVNKEVEQLGVTVKEQWATLGRTTSSPSSRRPTRRRWRRSRSSSARAGR